jgi:hypothetical protein
MNKHFIFEVVMSIEAIKAFAWGLFLLAGLRSCMRIRQEGWIKLVLVVLLAMSSWGSSVHWHLVHWFLLGAGIFSLLVLARPSLHARLTRRWQKVVGQLTDGLGLDIQAEVIPLKELREHLQANGLCPSGWRA